uniref:Large ribosomal subunit protein uL24c n=1 Tax=Crouania attenuata TaxID=42002 RepID=A0A4D6WPW5_9FLOR|nr:ribosomal protein L24 [Crouania attenuata]
MIKRIKKGDNVIIIAGSDKGKNGIIKKVILEKQQVLVENINLKTKHCKPMREGDKGEIQLIESPIHISNISKNDLK